MAGSNASRYLFLFLVGLMVGVVGVVMVMRAVDARTDHFPESAMRVMAWHMQCPDEWGPRSVAARGVTPG